jgi:hypothetical protein
MIVSYESEHHLICIHSVTVVSGRQVSNRPLINCQSAISRDYGH